MIGDSSLSLDQQPLTRVARVDLCAREKLDVVCQKLLQISLEIVSGAGSLGHETIRTEQENRIGHGADSTSKCGSSLADSGYRAMTASGLCLS